MPTWLVKDCLDVPISPITNIVNKLLSLAVFPRSMKAALVKLQGAYKGNHSTETGN